MIVITELRLAARRLARRPLFALAVVATLAIGIGANTAVFSLLEAVVLRDLPVPDPQRLVAIHELGSDGDPTGLGYATWAELATGARSFESMAAYAAWRPSIAEGGVAETISGLRATATLLPTLGVSPLLGRNFDPAEDAPEGARVALLSHGLWQRRFGSDPAAVGRTVLLNDRPYEVIGVLPAAVDSLLGPGPAKRLDVVVPLRYRADLPWACRTCRHLSALGRIAPGATAAGAAAEIDARFAALRADHPDEYASDHGRLTAWADVLGGPSRPLLGALLVGVLLVLALAIANVAALFAVRAVERERELAIRRSLGAGSRGWLVAAWSEPLLVVALGAGAGLLLARSLLPLLVSVAPLSMTRLDGVGLSLPVLAFTATVSILAALASGVAPALLGLRVPARDALAASATTSSGPRRGRFLGRLVVAQLALALVVVFAAGLLGRSLESLLGEDPGFRPAGVVVASVSASSVRLAEDTDVHAFFARALERVGALPGVTAAGWTSQLPLDGNVDSYSLTFRHRPDVPPAEEPYADRFAITPGYQQAIGLRLLAGRLLDDADREGSEPVILLNRTLVEKTWKGDDPRAAIGGLVRLGAPDSPWRKVVGVVEDVRHVGLDRPSTAQIYLPAMQWPWADSDRVLVVRSDRPAVRMAAPLRAAIHEIDPLRPVEAVRDMTDVVTGSAGNRSFAVGIWSSFALLALGLAALGTYGTLARRIALRRRELGIRSALGAAPRRLARAVTVESARMVVAALAIALPASLALGRALSSQLWKVGAFDPATLVLASAAVAAAALAASLGPAASAGRTAPASVLQEE